jgi:hypothetical protein
MAFSRAHVRRASRNTRSQRGWQSFERARPFVDAPAPHLLWKDNWLDPPDRGHSLLAVQVNPVLQVRLVRQLAAVKPPLGMRVQQVQVIGSARPFRPASCIEYPRSGRTTRPRCRYGSLLRVPLPHPGQQPVAHPLRVLLVAVEFLLQRPVLQCRAHDHEQQGDARRDQPPQRTKDQ